MFQTANDPGGGGGWGAFPYDLENFFINFHDIILVHFTRCFRHVLIGLFKNSWFWHFYSDLKIKSSENSGKNNIFAILFKMDFKYINRRRIVMRI